MALKPCKECKKEISTEAQSCPNCGAKAPKKTGFFGWFFLIFFSFIIVSCVTSFFRVERLKEREAEERAEARAKMTPEQRAEQDKKEAAEKKARELEQAVLSDYRVAAATCRFIIEKSLKDPDSAQWPRNWYTIGGISKKPDVLILLIQVRAKNSFGAYGLSTTKCEAEKLGKGNFQVLSLKNLD